MAGVGDETLIWYELCYTDSLCVPVRAFRRLPRKVLETLTEIERKKRNRTTRVVLFGLALMSLSWLIDAVVDAHFEHTALAEQFFSPDPRELLIRLIFLSSQLAFIIYIVILLKRRERLEADLADALQQTATEKTRNEAILEAFGDGISIQDLELRVLYQNAAHRASMGNHLGEFCYAAYQKRGEVCPGCHVAESFLDGQIHRRETFTEHSVKGRIDVEVVSTPLRDAEGKIFAGIEAVRDITERKRAEATIRRIQADLERRTRELSAANAELEAFGSTLAHDIRSFLARIATAAEVLEQIDAEQIGADGRYCVETIATASAGMERLVDSILVLSRVSHRELLHEEVDLSALAATIAAELAADEPQRPVEWQIDPGLVAIGDPGLLRIALENLLGNAWKYTRDAAPARIAFSRVEEDGVMFFCVRDNGIGFDMAEAGDLFRPFARLSGSRSFSGYGIGLTTVQRIVLRHGGTIRAESSPGAGARFCFTLPH